MESDLIKWISKYWPSRSMAMRILKAIFITVLSAIFISASISYSIQLVAGFIAFYKANESPEVVDINMKWIIENAGTPLFIFVIFMFVLMVFATWSLMNSVIKTMNCTREDAVEGTQIGDALRQLSGEVDKLRRRIDEIEEYNNRRS